MITVLLVVQVAAVLATIFFTVATLRSYRAIQATRRQITELEAELLEANAELKRVTRLLDINGYDP